MTNCTAISFGSAMVDIIAVLESDSIEKISLSNAHQQFLLVEPGRKVEARSITTHVGGGAINTGVCFSRLGCVAYPIVKTGPDPYREHVVEHCEANDLQTTGLVCDPDSTTGSAIMIASHDKNAAIFTHRGANTRLTPEDLETVEFDKADLVHIAPLSGSSAQLLLQIAEMGRDANCFVSLNPGIRQITTRTNSVLQAIRHVDLLAINEVEASALVPGISAQNANLVWRDVGENQPCLISADSKICLEEFCETLTGHGVGSVLVTFGDAGAWFFDGARLHHQAIVETEVAGTSGAGDSFISTLAWSLQQGIETKHALRLAAHNAASVVSFINTTDGLLVRSALFEKAGIKNV